LSPVIVLEIGVAVAVAVVVTAVTGDDAVVCGPIAADGDVTLPVGNGPAVTPALVGAVTEVVAVLTALAAPRLKLPSQAP
jgi:hypothetical protein